MVHISGPVMLSTLNHVNELYDVIKHFSISEVRLISTHRHQYQQYPRCHQSLIHISCSSNEEGKFSHCVVCPSINGFWLPGSYLPFFNLFFFQTFTTPCSYSGRHDILCNIFGKGSCSSVVYEEQGRLTLYEHMSTLLSSSFKFSILCFSSSFYFVFLVFVLCFMTNVNYVSGLSILIASLVFSK